MSKRSDEVNDFLVKLTMRAGYGDRPCPHCGMMITGLEEGLVFSGGGKFLEKYGVAAHPECFYAHEASKEWRENHPQYASKEGRS